VVLWAESGDLNGADAVLKCTIFVELGHPDINEVTTDRHTFTEF